MPALFNPSLSSQRYTYVESFLTQKPEITSITDVGCGNGRMVNWLKSVPSLEKVNCLDSDALLLDDEMDRYLRPNLLERLFGRKCSDKEIFINVYQGDASIPDERLKADCFSLIEMIEHITLEQVETISRTIFSYYQPKHVVVSTPNSEFNHLLDQHDQDGSTRPNAPADPNCKFRHFDHKFEWTRAEFNQWAQYVCNTYNYEYYMDGVGHLPGSEPFGPCTQIAVFTRKSIEASPIVQSDLDCFDLLLKKLSVEESTPEVMGDFNKRRICLMGQFSVPGNTHEAPIQTVLPNPDQNWEDVRIPKQDGDPAASEDDCIKCDQQYCYCKGYPVEPGPEIDWNGNEGWGAPIEPQLDEDCEMDESVEEQQGPISIDSNMNNVVTWW